jgi:hypothetical protein
MGRTWASMIQDVGHDRRTAPVSLLSLYEQIIEWDSETPLKRRSEGGVPPGPSKGRGAALSSPWGGKFDIPCSVIFEFDIPSPPAALI